MNVVTRFAPIASLSILSVFASTNAAWAADVNVKIFNFHKVNDFLYRGGQPEDQAWKPLAALGVKTVIDLRRPSEHSTVNEEKLVKAAGMRYYNFPMEGIVAPNPEDIAKILNILDSGEPVFVHCKEGKDRTGTVVACYRMARDGWNSQKALAEAKATGMHWVEFGMKQYILAYTPEARVATATPAPKTDAPVAAASAAAGLQQ